MKLGMKMMNKGCRDRDRATYTTAYSLVMPDNMHFARSHPPVACNKINYSSLRVERHLKQTPLFSSLSISCVRKEFGLCPLYISRIPLPGIQYGYRQTTTAEFVCLLYMVMLILHTY